VLGVDEFALREGHVYATILVDIETRRPVDLLPDRSVEMVAQWLADHPGVKVICPDRSAGDQGLPGRHRVALATAAMGRPPRRTNAVRSGPPGLLGWRTLLSSGPSDQ
jgi:hypothetical protein